MSDINRQSEYALHQGRRAEEAVRRVGAMTETTNDMSWSERVKPLNDKLWVDLEAMGPHGLDFPGYTQVWGADEVQLDGRYTRAMLRRIVEAMDEAERQGL